MIFDRIYRNSNKIEITIVVLSMLVAGISIFYSNYLSNQLAAQEKTQAILWARAMSQKAIILKKSKAIFNTLSDEERKKVELNAKATQLIITETNNDKLAFFLDIIKLNDQIPTISTDENRKILEFRNLNDPNIAVGGYLDSTKNPSFFVYQPIQIKFLDKIDYIYYRESNLYGALEEAINLTSNQFLDEIKNNSSALPTVLVDTRDSILNYGHIPDDILKNQNQFNHYVQDIKNTGYKIELDIDTSQSLKQTLYYKSSNMTSYIKWFPIFLYSVLAILVAIGLFAINKTRKNEKNLIWVGMSKETAHQLGTPLSSLTAWLQLLEDSEDTTAKQKNIVSEMKHDVDRLETIADRFSKIGSKPKLTPVNLNQELEYIYNYLKPRASKKIEFNLILPNKTLTSNINESLFEWVIENLVKNAFDSIVKDGKITIELSQLNDTNYITVTDSGKGVPSRNFEKVFEPGYTTKKRGWGLGLSLAKRIIENYFGGSIYIKSSKLGEGTAMQIALKAE